MVKIFLGFCCAFTLVVVAQTLSPRVDMVARATPIGGGGGGSGVVIGGGGTVVDDWAWLKGNPYFSSNLDTMTNRNNFPRFSNAVGRSPVGYTDSIHDFYIENSKLGIMSRKCTLSGDLAKNADGTYSDRLVLDFWKDGKPLALGAHSEVGKVWDKSARSLRMTARDHDDDDDDDNEHHGSHSSSGGGSVVSAGGGSSTGSSSSASSTPDTSKSKSLAASEIMYSYHRQKIDKKTGKGSFDVIYNIPSKKRLNLSVACRSGQIASMQSAQFTCTGNDINGETDVYYNEEFFCDVNKTGNGSVSTIKHYPISGKINAASAAELTIKLNDSNYKAITTRMNKLYHLGQFTDGDYVAKIVRQSEGLSCIFATGGQTVTVNLDSEAIKLPNINCEGKAVDTSTGGSTIPKNIILWKDGFEN